MDAKDLHRLLENYFREKGINPIVDLNYDDLKRKYPRAFRLNTLLAFHLGEDPEMAKGFPVTSLSVESADRIEKCVNPLELELVFIEMAFEVQELYIGGFQHVAGLSEEDTDKLRQKYRDTVDENIRPALKRAIEDFFSVS